MAVNNFPDGVAPDAVGFLANPPAPEALVPPLHGEDLTWVATNATRAPGLQPVTSTNPNGNYPGVPLSALGKGDG
jgi:hypothetical protein